MLRSTFASIRWVASRAPLYRSVAAATAKPFSTKAVDDEELERMAYLHHGKRPRFRNYTKFRSPRKRASKLLHELQQEAIENSKAANPKVWETKFNVGDAIELQVVAQGGSKSEDLEKIRGVVLGIFRKGLDHSVLLRDVVFGTPIERRIPLHSPLVKHVKVLEENFVYKGKRRVKRAKLYFLRDRNPLGMYEI